MEIGAEPRIFPTTSSAGFGVNEILRVELNV